MRHVAGTLLELEANPDFYMGRPRIDRVVLKFGGQPLAELLSGNVDVVSQATEADLLSLADDPRFRIYQAFTPHSVHAIAWNQGHPAFRDPRVRRALTQAVDREELLRVLNLPEDTPVLDVLFTEGQFRRGELPAPLPYDPEEASRLLEEAGWQDADDDGIRQRGGRPFEFSALVGPLFGLERAAVYIQSQLRRVGIRMEVERLEILALFERVTAREFDAVIADIHTRGDAGALHFEEDSPIGYSNPRVGSLLRQKGLMFDRAEVDSIYRELWPIFQADLPVTFLFPIVRTTIAHRRVRGLASPSRIDPALHIEQLWLEDEP
jgi:peptide/nickel transport system substrate-binding protein